MTTNPLSLRTVYEGWEGYQTSLVKAIAPRTREELAYRPAPSLRSVGQIAAHISFGRIDWFGRMKAPGSAELAALIEPLCVGSDAAPESGIAEDAAALVDWLEKSWKMVENVLNLWTVEDLGKTYLQPYRGTTYIVSRQWTIWRILSHDIQHGGQLTVMLDEQGVRLHELCDLGGHLTELPVAGSDG